MRCGMKALPRIGPAALAALIVVSASAQDYPTQTVKIVVPAAAGSTTDTLARLVADALARKWGKPTVVENIAGGSMYSTTCVRAWCRSRPRSSNTAWC